MTVSELIDELSTQPSDATVIVTGEVMCEHDDHTTYANVEIETQVVGVRSTHPKLVWIEVRE